MKNSGPLKSFNLTSMKSYAFNGIEALKRRKMVAIVDALGGLYERARSSSAPTAGLLAIGRSSTGPSVAPVDIVKS